MQTVITTGVLYSQLLEDLRNIIRFEVQSHTPTPPAADDAGPELLTVRDAAALLDVCPQSIHEYSRKGLLRKHRLGGRVYLKRSEVLASLQSQQRTLKGKGGKKSA
jgi:hypothetical protein